MTYTHTPVGKKTDTRNASMGLNFTGLDINSFFFFFAPVIELPDLTVAQEPSLRCHFIFIHPLMHLLFIMMFKGNTFLVVHTSEQEQLASRRDL